MYLCLCVCEGNTWLALECVLFFWSRLKEHISDSSNNPILIFPEGESIYTHTIHSYSSHCEKRRILI